MEFPANDDGLEDCTSSCLWQHGGAQTRRADPANCPVHGISHQRGNETELFSFTAQ